MAKKIRIKDIADIAGVSAGTVDRVLHNRGHVAEDKRIKIEAALKKMNYTPNIHISQNLQLENIGLSLKQE